MGYETRIHIVEKYSYSKMNEDVFVGSEIARLNLSKIGESNFYKLWEKTKKETSDYWGFWADDGNTIIKEDRYGDKLVGIPLNDCIKALSRDTAKSKYRRFAICLNLLNSIADGFNSDSIFVIWFGY